ncbi:MAG: TonB-dependent siderophore receptor [Methylobacter sp.]|nr:MAG: TonB-dependent siderophore receptor [Methylobacter sp.]
MKKQVLGLFAVAALNLVVSPVNADEEVAVAGDTTRRQETLESADNFVADGKSVNPDSRKINRPAATELPSINVVSEAESKTESEPYQETKSTAGTKFEADIIRVPQSIQVINNNLLKDEGVISVGDILKSVPSANVGRSRLSNFSSFDFTIRGFDAGFTRNGFRQLFFEDVDQSAFSNVERLEISKGPSSSLFGQEGLGGTLNFVTKRPQAILGASAWGEYGENDLGVGGFDITGPLSANGRLKGRVNGEFERSGSFIDFQDIDRDNLALSVDYDGDRWKAYFNVEYQLRETRNTPGLPPEGTLLPDVLNRGQIVRNRYLGDPQNDFLQTGGVTIQHWYDFKLTDNWTLTPRFQYFQFNVDQNQIRIRGQEFSNGVATGNLLRDGRLDFFENDDGYTAQLDLKGKFDTGPLHHQVAIGGEYDRFNDIGQWFNLPVSSSSGLGRVTTINPFSPAYPSGIYPASATGLTTLIFDNDTTNLSAYIQDLVAITSQIDFQGSIRYNNLENVSGFDANQITSRVTNSTDLFTYQIGASYRPVDWLALFSGYGTGLNFDDVAGSVNNSGTPFAPEESEQFEIGFKWDIPQTGLTGTLAYFDITRSNVTTTDPENPNFSIQAGEEQSQGGELELAWQITPQWFMQAGYAYIDAKVTNDIGVNDLGQITSGFTGNRLANVAEHQANFFTRYTIPLANQQKLSFGLGSNFVGKRPGVISGEFSLDSYTTLDLSAAYERRNIKVELFAKNVLNEEYFTGTGSSTSVFAGDPRQVFTRVTLRY